MESVDRGIRNFSTAAHLDTGKELLPPELLVKSCLRDVGDILEGSLQPYTRLRLSMRDIAANRIRNGPTVASMTFGQVITELISSGTCDKDIYSPLALGVTVSQWRNVANHNSYEVYGDKIICTYGKPGNVIELRLPIIKVIDLLKDVNNLCFVHKIAFEVFSIDNISDIQQHAPEVALTEGTRNGVIVSGLVSGGFSIIKAGVETGSVALALLDTQSRNNADAKAALQEALSSYILLSGAVDIVAVVQSSSARYRFSFHGAPPHS
jgi:hypothetical protein